MFRQIRSLFAIGLLIILVFGTVACKHYKVEPAEERAVSPNVKRQNDELKDQ